MNNCPYCKEELQDLDPIMDQLALDKRSGVVYFDSACCKMSIKAYSELGMYYIVPVDGTVARQFIGGA